MLRQKQHPNSLPNFIYRSPGLKKKLNKMGKKNLPEIKISYKKLVRIFQISLLVITLSLFPGRKMSMLSNPITADNTNQTEKKKIEPEPVPPPIPGLAPNVLYPEISAQGVLIKDLD